MADANQQELIETLEAFLVDAEKHRVAAKMEDASKILKDSVVLLLANGSYAEVAEQILAAGVAPLQREKAMSKVSPEHEELLRIHARICSLDAIIYSDQDRLDEAEHQIEQSLALSQALGTDDGKAFFVLADIHRKQGKYEQSISELTSSVSLLKQQGDERTASFALDNLAHAVSAVGNLEQACGHRKEAIAIAEKLGEAIPLAIFQGNLAKDYYRLGDLERAEKTIHMALAGLKNNDPRCESYSYRVLGDILVAQNKISEARNAYLEAAKSEVTHCYAMASVGLGWWEFRFGSAKNAASAFEVAMDPQVPQQDDALKTEALAGLALAQSKLGKGEDAIRNIAAALKHGITRNNLYVRGLVLAAHAALLKAAGNEEGALDSSTRSDDAFKACARPLVGLSDKLFEKLKT